MATNTHTALGLTFVPNNYSAILNSDGVHADFHLFQRFLRNSEINRALTEPGKNSASQIKAFLESGVYDSEGSPSIIFTYNNTEYKIDVPTAREALGLENQSAYTISVGNSELRKMLTEIGYGGPMEKLGQLKRPHLRREWSFFFDCITRAFQPKCTNWDAIPLKSLQMGYALIYDLHYDYARIVIKHIGNCMDKSRKTVYFTRFCQLFFSTCVNVPIEESDEIPSFKLHKRVFSDLISKDNKTGRGTLMLPTEFKAKLGLSTTVPQSERLRRELLATESTAQTKFVGTSLKSVK